MNGKSIQSLSALVLAICLSPALQAQPLFSVKTGATTLNGGVDGAYQEGAAVLGSASSWWNDYAYVSTTPSGVSVVDDSGTSIAGVTLTIANSTGTGSKATAGTNLGFLFGSQPYQNAGGIFTISITGLSADTEYEFIGYAARTSSTAGASWAVTTGTLDSGTTSNDGSSMDITTGVGKSYSLLYATTDGSGNLTVTDSGNPGTSITVLAGFQIEAAVVPEPSAIALTVVGFGLLAGKLLRRQR